jgi:hypothetical protein
LIANLKLKTMRRKYLTIFFVKKLIREFIRFSREGSSISCFIKQGESRSFISRNTANHFTRLGFFDETRARPKNKKIVLISGLNFD